MSLFAEHKKRMSLKYAHIMLEAVSESMSCRFHVEIDKVHNSFGDSAFFHEHMTFIESHNTSKGNLELFHYKYKKEVFEMLFMNFGEKSFRIDYKLDIGKT